MTAVTESRWEWLTIDDLDVDPYPIYRRLRHEAPVAYIPQIERWAITTWEHCDALGRDEEAIGSDNAGDAMFGIPNILGMEIGPEHKALRAAIDRQFRARRLLETAFEQHVRPVVARYVERFRERGTADATTEIFEPLSSRVVADLLGLSDLDDETLVRWFHSIFDGLTGIQELRGSDQPGVGTALSEIDAYMSARIATLHHEGDDGSALASMVFAGRVEGHPRSFAELIGTIKILIGGGFQEPGHGAATSLLGVLLDPEQTRAVVTDPDTYIPLAVHEGLRWISPFGFCERRARREIEIGGAVIPAGAPISLFIASGNRDERRYVDPDRFDLFRERLPHMSFGFRSHFCSGHAVARSLEQIALEEMFTRLPGLRLDPEREPITRGWTTRSVTNLPIAWNR